MHSESDEFKECASFMTPSDSDAENGTLNGNGDITATDKMSFQSQCQQAIALGLAALKYGYGGASVEHLLNRIVTKCCSQTQDIQSAVFRVSNNELFCSIIRSDKEWPITIITDIQEGYQLDKLSKLAYVLKKIESGDLSLQDSKAALDEIEKDHEPYGFLVMGLSWTVVGFGLPPVLGGTWWDALVGAALATITYLVSIAFAKYLPDRLQDPWNNVAIAFVAAVLSTVIKIGKSEINVVFTILSAIAIPLPGFSISIGISHLLVGRIIPGMASLIGGLVTLAWLLFGAYLGFFIVDRAASIPNTVGKPVPGYWQALFVPLLCVGLAIAFQTAYRDFSWSILCQGLAYCIVVGFSYLPQDEADDTGMVASSIVMTLFSNIWSRWKDKPTQIILIPSIVLQVSGTIGFRGIISLQVGDTEVGTQQFLRMFYVAVLIYIGVAIGMSICPPTRSM